jgi:hypothetical protein
MSKVPSYEDDLFEGIKTPLRMDVRRLALGALCAAPSSGFIERFQSIRHTTIVASPFGQAVMSSQQA